MKEEIIKASSKQNLVEKVKAIKEVGHLGENAMDNNAKNTKELYEVLKKELETNEHLDDNFHKIIEQIIEAYDKALDNATSEEERRIIYDKLEKVVEEAIKKYDDNISNNKEVRESAMKVDEDNRNFNWGTVVNFGIGVLAIFGGVAIGTKGFDVAKKFIEKK